MKKLQWRQGLVLGLFGWLRWLALACLMAGAASSAFATKTYSDNGDGTVTDPTTGLQWMRCAMGYTWDGSACTGIGSGYTWDQANALTGTVTFAGQSDWRLPNIRELTTITDRSRFYPAIDVLVFPNMQYPWYVWSSTPGIGAWYVSFDYGRTQDDAAKSLVFNVRLVRGGQSTVSLLNTARPTTDYFDHGDGTVTHTPTGLMWQRCAEGQTWVGGTCSGSATGYPSNTPVAMWDTFAGNSDWRLPTISELETMVDYTVGNPAINSAMFPNPATVGWSASTVNIPSYPGYNVSGHVVSFYHGYEYLAPLGGLLNARLVRAGQSTPIELLISKSGAGTVSSSAVSGIDCGITCSGTYTPGTRIILTAAPTVNLISWGGACSGNAATCIVTMDAAKTVTASFKDTPLISGLPATLSFALRNIGSTSAAQNVTLTNSGTAALTIASIAATGDYGVTHNCGSGLGAGGFCTLNISFSPTGTGTRTGAVTITSDALGSPHSIALSGSGQGAVAWLSATSKAFASQGTGSTSGAQSVTLTNTGGAVLNIASILASGDFAQTTTCGATLAQAANCSISITFTPTAVGARGGSVVITSDAANSPNTISLTGTGVAVPMVTLSLMSLNFAIQNIGTSSTAQTIQLSNTGGAALNLSSIASSGDFAVTNNCGAGLAIGGSCNLSVTFVPTVAGARSGAITITSNAQGSPHTVTLSGGSNAIATQTIVFGTAPSILVGGTATVGATASSGLSVTFSSLTTGVCTISGNTVTAVSVGTCTVAANQAGNASYSAAAQVTQSITVTASTSRLINLSTRGPVQTADNVMIGGFIISGSTPKTVLITARGPSLAAYGVPGVLANPVLNLYSGQTVIATNDNWGDAPNVSAIQATGVAPTDSLESAILTTLSPGPYTAIVSGANNTTGVGIVEVFEVDNANAPLINISTRGRVLTGDSVLIGGFIIQGNSPQKVLIRAVGPNLANYGVPGVLADPVLQLFSGQTTIASNDNWVDAANAAAIQATGTAPVYPQESAILITLDPGPYTTIVSGASGTTGVGIVEVIAQ